jgi:F0F1-type ATP synthase alpha subunit
MNIIEKTLPRPQLRAANLYPGDVFYVHNTEPENLRSYLMRVTINSDRVEPFSLSRCIPIVNLNSGLISYVEESTPVFRVVNDFMISK